MEIYSYSPMNIFRKHLGLENLHDLGVFWKQNNRSKIKILTRSATLCIIASIISMISFTKRISFMKFLFLTFLVSSVFFIVFFILFSSIELMIDRTKVKSASILAISDLVIILHTSNNLDTGIAFLEDRNYHKISEVCRLSSNQANCSDSSLVDLFRDNLNQFVYFDVRNTFLDLLKRWEISPNISEDLRDKLARDYLDNIERGNKNVELIVSIYVAFGAILPQVSLIMLCLSGNLNLSSFSVIILLLLLIFVFIPTNIIFDNNTEDIFDLRNSPISPSILAGFLGNCLKKGMTLEEGMICLHSTIINSEFPGKDQINEITHHYIIGWEISEQKLQQYGQILCGRRGGHIISSYHRFAQLNTSLAGENLVILSNIFKAQEKAANNRMIYIQSEYKKLLFLCVVSSFTLGLLLACIPMFSNVAIFIKTNRLTNLNSFSSNGLISDTSYYYVFLINFAISLLPAKLRNNRSILFQKENIVNSLLLSAIFLVSSMVAISYSLLIY